MSLRKTWVSIYGTKLHGIRLSTITMMLPIGANTTERSEGLLCQSFYETLLYRSPLSKTRVQIISPMNPETTVMELNQGQQLFTEGNFEGAIAVYRHALEINSKNSWAYHHMGEALAKLGQFDEAVTAYRHAIELKSDVSWTYHHLGDALVQQQKWEESATAFRQGIELNSEHFGTYVGLGNSLAKLGQLDEAIAAYRRATELNPDANWIHHALVNALQQRTQSDLAEAIASYHHIIEINPDNVEAYQNLLQVQPDNSETWLQLAQAFVRQEQIEEAITAYRRVVALNPSSDEAYHELGSVLAREEKWEEAIAAYQRVIELSPELAQTYYLLGEAEVQVGEIEKAIVSYRHAGELLVKQGKIDEAIAAFQQLVLQKPTAPEYLNLGMLFLQQHRLEEALNCHQKALEIQPEQADAYSNLATLLIQKGCLNEVIACYHKVFDRHPSSAGIYHRLSTILAQQGFIDEGIACFREAQRQPSQGEIYEHIWKGLNQLGVLDESNPYYQVEINPEDAKNHFMQTNPYRTIILESLTDDDKSFLENTGISLTNLQLITQDSLVLEEIYINSFASGSLSDSSNCNSPLTDSEPIKLAQKVDKGFAYYQQSLVETGYVYAVCPISGRILRSNQSVYIQHNSFLPTGIYRFVGNEIFYLIFGCHHSIWLAIYFPRWELIVRPANNPFSTDYFTLLNELKGGAVGFWQKFKHYISSKEDKKEIAAVVGWLGNLGHYFWNDLSGIQNLSDNQTLSKVNKFLMGNYNFFNIGEIFPEIPSENIVYIPDRWSLFRTTLENNYFTVRLTDVVIKERLANNIYQAAISQCSQEFLQKLAKAKKHFPLLWIQIRLRYRVWVSQVEGIANIIKSLHSDYPNLGVVIVGNWYFTETDEIEGCPQIENEKATLEQILALIPPTINLYSAIGHPSYEIMAWANAIDTYIVPFASGITFVAKLANKVGVIHTTIGLAATVEPTVLSMRENAVSPVVPREHIVDLGDGNPVLCDYDCDWKGIYDEVVKIINNLGSNE